jgi:hypothetical protein
MNQTSGFTVFIGLVIATASNGSNSRLFGTVSAQDTEAAVVSGNSEAPTQVVIESATTEVSFVAPQVQRWRIGLVLSTPVTCTDAYATFPIPMEWPEQKVRVISKQVDPAVTNWTTRELPGGAKQVLVQMPRVVANQTVEITFMIEIERSRIVGPTDPSQLKIPAKPNRDLKSYLASSPYIDHTDIRIRKAWQEIEAQPAEHDWQRVEQIYDYVRDKVKYVNGDLKNASQALRDGTGDCEEMTSLFIALCRNAGVPARMVWIPEHCYPEFYLETSDGKGHWYPCQAAGSRAFGSMDEYRPVLQKGDRFKVPESKTPVRYVAEFFRCEKSGKSNPKPKFVREQVDIN